MAIIGISGANGVGKDTVGKIIQWLTSKHTFPNYYSDIDKVNNFGEHINGSASVTFQIRKFATKVNQSYKLITGIDFHSLSRENKELERPRFIEFAESCKEVFGERVWLDAEFKDYVWDGKSMTEGWRPHYGNPDNSRCEKEAEPIFPNWIFTDVRFEEEVSEIKRHNGIMIYVFKNSVLDYKDKLTSTFKDYAIINDSTIEDLIPKVKEILVKEQICKE